MGQNSKIEWCHHTANFWWGCEEVHSGCDHCYAKTLSHRYDGGNPLWGKDSPRRRIKSTFDDLDKYQRAAEKANEIHRVFVGSMMDIFEKSKPLLNPIGHHQTTDDLRQELFTKITWDGGLYPNLMFLFLTKRPSNIPKYVPTGWLYEPPKNVMYGTSVSDQNTANTLVPQLLKVPGKKFLSCEPLLGPIDFSDPDLLKRVDISYGAINWIIVGGESGRNARPMHPEWVRGIREQCEEHHIPFLFKQWGEFAYVEKFPFPIDHMTNVKYYWSDNQFIKVNATDPSDVLQKWPLACRIGKSKSGNLLDGKQYLNFPI